MEKTPATIRGKSEEIGIQGYAKYVPYERHSRKVDVLFRRYLFETRHVQLLFVLLFGMVEGGGKVGTKSEGDGPGWTIRLRLNNSQI